MKDNYQTLEFAMIQEIIANSCVTDLAKKQAFALSAFTDEEDLHEELKRTDEAMTIHRLLGRLPLSPMSDITRSLKKAQMDGVLQCEELYEINHILNNVVSLKQYFSSYEGDIAALKDQVEGLTGDDSLSQEILRCIMPDMSVSDHASEALYRIRKQMRSLEMHIRSSMEGYLKNAGDALSLDSLSTKNDRLVLAVKSSHKGEFKGLIHSTSASGQTFFIEPENVVVMNNELNELKSDEQEEINRILLMLSQRVKQDHYILKFDQELLSQIDFLFGKARFGCDYDGVIPEVTDTFVLSLKQARHPLIDQQSVIANDIVLDKNMLLITGSNTGGKTVAMKTAGLLSLMALSGLPVPAVSAHVPFFDEIYVDVGDEQSIEQSLSTYSSHMKRQIAITREAGSRSLVLIDEIGSGTDPQEGAALAKAIIEALLKKKCMIIASTHYGELKTFGKSHEEIALASVGFDMETMKPTYQLKLNSVGSSYAFEIARSLGLDEAIIDRGLAYKEESISAEEKLMEKLTKQEEELNDRQAELETLLMENKRNEERLERRLAQAEKQKQQILDDAQEKANNLLEESKQMIQAIADDMRKNGEIKDHHIIEAKHELDQLKILKEEDKKIQEHIFETGDHVRVDAMNREGDVVEILKNHQLLISINGMNVKLKDHEITFMHPLTKQKKKKTSTRSAVKKTGSYEVNVIGMRYQEAMDTVDKFLDDAVVMGYPSVRIIHGMGTGVLRNGIRKMLDRNKFVSSYRDGGPNEGGLGATLVYFE